MKIVKFLSSSVIATLTDFLLYGGLVVFILPAYANIISASTGMVVNFFIQRVWVFSSSRGLCTSFVLSSLFSLGGLALGTFIVFGLTTWTLLSAHPIIAKIISVGFLFVYNYETKKIAFGDT